VVAASWALPAHAARWGARPEARGWRRAFATAAHHPVWGADLAAQAGAAPLTVDLIRRHQARLERRETPADELLALLQTLDDDA
jgi:hypothetical protein